VATGVVGQFSWIEGPAGRCLRHDRLASLASHIFTTRQLAFRDESFERDSARLAEALGVEPDKLVWVRQVHGRSVIVVTPDVVLAGAPDADAIVSTDPERAIAVRVADCLPVLLADVSRRVVAAVHAGWRGVCGGVIGAAVSAITELGVPAAELVGAVGPSVGPCCYQVDDKVRHAFLAMTPDAAAWFTEDGPGHWRLDLWQAATDQLTAAGLRPEAVHVARLCTADRLEDCYSYRKEGPGTGRLAAAIRCGRGMTARLVDAVRT